MHTAFDPDRFNAIEVATALVEVSRNLSTVDKDPNFLIAMERLYTRKRIEKLCTFMASLGYQQSVQDFDCGVGRAMNVFWRDKSYEHIDYLITCHSDYIAGTGAVDNASGAGVMVSAARECRLRGIKNVAFAAFDAEERGLKGSSAFISAYAEDLPSPRPNIINVDSVGKGKLVQLHSQFKNSREIILPLAQWTSSGLRTDADSFIAKGFRTATISSYDEIRKLVAECWRDGTEPNAPSGQSESFSAGNVCNTADDTVRALCEETMTKATELVLKIVTPYTS